MEGIPNKSYKVKEVAEILGCTQDNVYRLVKYGHLKAFRVGSRVNIRITDIAIKDFLREQEYRKKEMRDDG